MLRDVMMNNFPGMCPHRAFCSVGEDALSSGNPICIYVTALRRVPKNIFCPVLSICGFIFAKQEVCIPLLLYLCFKFKNFPS
jgi:hypothetical protein